MARFVAPALQQYRLERDRRLGRLISAAADGSSLNAESEAPSDAGPPDDPEPLPLPITLVEHELVRETPVPVAEPGRSIRVRVAPTRFDANLKRQRVRIFTPEEKAQDDTNKVWREQMRHNNDTIWKNATAFSCPLLRADKIAAGDFEEGNLRSLLGTQMRQVVVADDGQQYDLGAIKAYIQANMDRRLVSPTTNEPMTCSVRYAGNTRGNDGTLRKTLEVRTWRPDLITDVDI